MKLPISPRTVPGTAPTRHLEKGIFPPLLVGCSFPIIRVVDLDITPPMTSFCPSWIPVDLFVRLRNLFAVFSLNLPPPFHRFALYRQINNYMPRPMVPLSDSCARFFFPVPLLFPLLFRFSFIHVGVLLIFRKLEYPLLPVPPGFHFFLSLHLPWCFFPLSLSLSRPFSFCPKNFLFLSMQFVPFPF